MFTFVVGLFVAPFGIWWFRRTLLMRRGRPATGWWDMLDRGYTQYISGVVTLIGFLMVFGQLAVWIF